MANIGSRSTGSGSGTSVAAPTAIVFTSVNSLDPSVGNYDWQPITTQLTDGFSVQEVDSISPGSPNVLVFEQDGMYQCDIYFKTNNHVIDAAEQFFVGRHADGGILTQPNNSPTATVQAAWKFGAETHTVMLIKAGEQWQFGFGPDDANVTTNTTFSGQAFFTRIGELPDFL